MQFAARGALSVPAAENIEILVYLARHNKVFGDLARMTLAGWDEKACLAAAADPQTPREVLDYMLSPENLRPKLLPALLENPSVLEDQLVKFALSASRESIETMLRSVRVKACNGVLSVLKSNPYLKKEESDQIDKLLNKAERAELSTVSEDAAEALAVASAAGADVASTAPKDLPDEDVPDEGVAAYLKEHAAEVAAEEGTSFQAVGGVVELLGADYFPVAQITEVASNPEQPATGTGSAAAPKAAHAKKNQPAGEGKRENTLQKINNLDVKGRIQLALKGNKEERSILIRDGTKVVALAVLEAPKLADGEVEKFAGQKNVLEAVLRQIPLKRRFMKNYLVVRNLVFNPRTPLDLSLGLVKNLLVQDLKNLSTNKEVSDTIRKLGLKMYKQKMETANKK
jgi:hypothetical protein